jgi:hypothetical protein
MSLRLEAAASRASHPHLARIARTRKPGRNRTAKSPRAMNRLVTDSPHPVGTLPRYILCPGATE